MTIQEAITQTDSLKPNQYTQQDKIKWLSDVDGTIFKEIINTHDNPDDIGYSEYKDNTDTSTQLLAEDPYGRLYIHYLMSMIDYYNGEFQRYNNTSALFNQSYQDYANYYNRMHRSTGIHRFSI